MTKAQQQIQVTHTDYRKPELVKKYMLIIKWQLDGFL